MCIGDDGNENLEFEMTLNLLTHTKPAPNSFSLIIM
jgi:hypothetical protein